MLKKQIFDFLFENKEKETEEVLSEARKIGLNDEALEYFRKFILENIQETEKVSGYLRVYFCGNAKKVPTISTGGGNYYYFHEKGNAFFDRTLDYKFEPLEEGDEEGVVVEFFLKE